MSLTGSFASFRIWGGMEIVEYQKKKYQCKSVSFLHACNVVKQMLFSFENMKDVYLFVRVTFGLSCSWYHAHAHS